MRTKRALARKLMAELKEAYKILNTTQPCGDDWDAVSQAIGRYDGLKCAYVLLTGRSGQDVATEVVTWYIRTPEYQTASHPAGA